jgi:hypothetical protein
VNSAGKEKCLCLQVFDDVTERAQAWIEFEDAPNHILYTKILILCPCPSTCTDVSRRWSTNRFTAPRLRQAGAAHDADTIGVVEPGEKALEVKTEEFGNVVRTGVVEMATSFDQDAGLLRTFNELGGVKGIAAQPRNLAKDHDPYSSAIDEAEELLKSRPPGR